MAMAHNAANVCLSISKVSRTVENIFKHGNDTKLRHTDNPVPTSHERSISRRLMISCAGASLVAVLAFSGESSKLQVLAEEEKQDTQEEKDDGVIGTIKSLFDPYEKTKSGKVLPKAYLKSAREVVKKLRDSLKEDPKDDAKFRRTADAAKESIKEYISSWRGQQEVVKEESYDALLKAIRSLASFYSKAGPFAQLPDDVKSEILDDLATAEQFL